LDTAVRVASTDLTVLINGESGVGKEVFSKIIHSLSSRKHNNFIAINCGAIPGGTINSELFGHEKGAFTGATSERKGYFETVDGGTIFLDEIGEMPLDTQAFLLRILESGEFIKVGSSKVLKTNVRVIAATNVDLLEKFSKGKFREDLYYRLNTVPIRVPALKDRREDIYMLFRKFATDFADKYKSSPIQLDDRARLLIENYAWPGNIRELRNMSEQLSVLAEDQLLTADRLIEMVPKITQRNLPALRDKDSGNGESFQEREILYKLLFDMKNDMNDLKSLVFELIKSNDLSVSNVNKLKQLQSHTNSSAPAESNPYTEHRSLSEHVHNVHPNEDYNFKEKEDDRHVFIPSESEPNTYDSMEIVEESLSLEDMEKDMIKKALKKHKGRRKDASIDLGISERTLYRKIKQYELG
jgi:DNA-binding NtrC family response regulator